MKLTFNQIQSKLNEQLYELNNYAGNHEIIDMQIENNLFFSMEFNIEYYGSTCIGGTDDMGRYEEMDCVDGVCVKIEYIWLSNDKQEEVKFDISPEEKEKIIEAIQNKFN